MASKHDIMKVIQDVRQSLDNLEETMLWGIYAHNRFKVRQRVQFSKYADRRGIPQGRKNGVRRGRVVTVSKFSVKVLLDGYKRPIEFFHGFLDPVDRRKDTHNA